MNDPVSFANAEDARRTFRAVVDFEKFMAGKGEWPNGTERFRVRVTGAGSHSPALPAYWAVVAGNLVFPTNDGAATNGHDTLYTGVLLVYPSSETAPAVGATVDAQLGWTDDTGAAVWVKQSGGSSGAGGDGDWETLEPVMEVTCESGTIVVEKLTGTDFWTRATP